MKTFLKKLKTIDARDKNSEIRGSQKFRFPCHFILLRFDNLTFWTLSTVEVLTTTLINRRIMGTGCWFYGMLSFR